MVQSALFSLTVAGSAGAKPVPTPAQPLSSREAIRVLLVNKDVPLRGIESCQSVKDPADLTVGDYTATIFSRLAETSISWNMALTFRSLGNASRKLWHVRLSLQGSDAGEVFDTGVMFDYDEKAAKLVKGSFKCSGTI